MILNSVTELAGLMTASRMSDRMLEKIRNHRLRRAVRYAYENVPFYRDRFDAAGIKPSDIRTVKDLEHLPLVTKSELAYVPVEYRKARGIDLDECAMHMTSGSTGEPFRIWFTPSDARMQILGELRLLMHNGMKPSDNMLLIVDMRGIRRRKFWFQRLGILNREYIDISEDREKILKLMHRPEFDVLEGYTSEFFLLSMEILERGLPGPRPELVVTSAEYLDPIKRLTIQKALHKDPVDIYSTIESGHIAWECPARNGYHINTDMMALETVRDGAVCAPGESGEVVVTPFYSSAMPLIRYVVADLAVISQRKCPCGCSLPLLERIEGRCVDSILFPSGEVVSPYIITCAIEEIKGLRQFMIVQKTLNDIDVDFICESADAKRIKSEIESDILRVIEEGMKVRARHVESIPREVGKFSYVKNLVAREDSKG